MVEATLPPGERAVAPGVMMTSLLEKRGGGLEFQVGIGARLLRQKIAHCKSVGRGSALYAAGYLEVVDCEGRSIGVRASSTSLEAVELTPASATTPGRVLAGVALPAGLEVQLGTYVETVGWVGTRRAE